MVPKVMALMWVLQLNIRIQCNLIHKHFNRDFWSMDFMIWDNYFVFNPMGLRSDILSSGLEWKLNLKFETRCLSAAASQVPVQIQCHDGGSCCPECTVLLSWYLLKIKSVWECWIRLYVWGIALAGLSSLQCHWRLEATLEVGFICLFVVIDPTYFLTLAYTYALYYVFY